MIHEIHYEQFPSLGVTTICMKGFQFILKILFGEEEYKIRQSLIRGAIPS